MIAPVLTSDFVEVLPTRHGWLAFNRHDKVIGKSLRNYGEWAEAELSGGLLQFIKPGMLVMDIGAHIGTHTLAFAKAAGPKGFVVAFEPQHQPHRFLTANCLLNSLQNVEVRHQAVSDKCGKTTVHHLDPMHPNNFGAFGIGAGDYEVETVTLDSLPIPIVHVIKVDVEGHELAVLQGGEKTITKFRPTMLLEATKDEHTPALLRWLTEHAYDCYWFATPAFNPDNFYQCADDAFPPGAGDMSILAVPSGSTITGLPPIADVDDTWARLRERMKA